MPRASVVAIVLLFGLWAGLAFAQNDSAVPVPYVYRLKIGNCTFDPADRRQTGFRVQGVAGMVTALHGVADCQTISAIADNGQEVFNDLVIQQVDIERDIALLISPDLMQKPSDGLMLSRLTAQAILTTPLSIVGYPLGLDEQDVESNLLVRDFETLDAVIPDPEETDAFRLRRSPALTITVLNMQAQLLPGHSGAPLFDPENHLVGVGNGGLRGGTVNRSWAIPWQDIDWQPVENDDIKEKLGKLATQDIAALAFSSIYPDPKRSDIQIGPLVTLNLSICYESWDCRTAEISASLFSGKPVGYWPQNSNLSNTFVVNERLCEFSFLVLNSQTELPIDRAYVTILLKDKSKTGYTLGNGFFKSSIPCNESYPSIEVHVSANGYKPISQLTQLTGNIEKVYLPPLILAAEAQPAETIIQASTIPTLTLVPSYPCEAEIISSTGAQSVNTLRAKPSVTSTFRGALVVGTKIMITQKMEEAITWYRITPMNGGPLGWIPAENLHLSTACPQ